MDGAPRLLLRLLYHHHAHPASHLPSTTMTQEKLQEHRHYNGRDDIIDNHKLSSSEKDMNTDPESVDYRECPVEENYKVLGRWRACVLLITIEVGIGVLSLPSALHTLGLIPGVIAIIGFGIVTTYCGYILLQFYRKYPMITNLVDCAYHVGGKPFEIFLGVAFILNLILICSSANITM